MVLAITIVQLLVCVAIIVIVTLQSGKSSGLGVLSGSNNNNFMTKNKSKSLDSRLASATKWFAAAFVVLTLVLNIVL